MRRVVTLILAVLPWACGRGEPSSGDEMQNMPGMTAADTAADPMAGMEMPDTLRLSPQQAAAIGLTYTTVERGPLVRMVRTVGRIVPAEPRIAEVSAKIEGFADTVFAAATGITVRRGDPLIALYSPMLVSAQEELITALRLGRTVGDDPEARRNADALVAAGRRRLAYWDISPEQIQRLEQTGEVTRTLTLTAPVTGVILEKMVVTGQSVMPGMKLYQLADLSEVWIEGDVYEQDLSAVQAGASVHVAISAYPGRGFMGRVQFVWPVVEPESRTGRIRVALPNRSGDLKPGMYATLSVETRSPAEALSLPGNAVVRTGERNVVFVALPDGSLETRNVVLGTEAGDRVQIVSGIQAGERVVASGNFLVDAESRLEAAGMPGMPGMAPAAAPGRDTTHPHGQP